MQKSSDIGGQAVLEGIMMRHLSQYAIAVRKSDGEIVVKTEPYKTTIPIAGIEKIPVLRGISAFVDSLVVGISCLMYSAEFYEEEDTSGRDAKKAGKDAGTEDGKAGDTEEKKQGSEKGKKEGSWDAAMTGTVILSIALTVGLFILLPYFLASLLRGIGAGEVTVSLAEALLRIAIFLAYMILVSNMKDIQRVFMYHGAEHKCINCVEHGMPLTVENVMKCSRQHKRCGTSFLLFVVLISVFFFLIIGLLGIRAPLMRLLVRLLFIPIIAGAAYELIRFAGRSENRCVSALSAPGLLLQKLVTREPDEKQVEVAIAAVEAVFDWKEYLRTNFPEAQTGQ